LWRDYLKQIPNILATLTTATILFAAAVLFQPRLQRLFSPAVPDYPISCSAAVAADLASGLTRSVFFIINHSDKEYDAKLLAEQLAIATGANAALPDTSIILPYGGYNGRFVAARADRMFNGDKAELAITTTPTTIRIQIKRIAAAAVLKVDIEALQSPAPSKFTADTKAALPFDNRDYERRCYRG